MREMYANGCPVCGARSGEECIGRSGAVIAGTHEERVTERGDWAAKYDLRYRQPPGGRPFLRRGNLKIGGVMPTWDEAERLLMDEALKRTGGNALKAAAMLGIGKTTMYRKLAEREERAA